MNTPHRIQIKANNKHINTAKNGNLQISVEQGDVTTFAKKTFIRAQNVIIGHQHAFFNVTHSKQISIIGQEIILEAPTITINNKSEI